MSETVGHAVEQVSAPKMIQPVDGHSSDSDCFGGRGTAPSPGLYPPGPSLDSPPYSERQSNNTPQDFHSSTENVDNLRPPMSRLTAQTLRKAHAQVRVIHRLGRVAPDGLSMLERDYNAWRSRVRRGTQRETLLAVGECIGDGHTNTATGDGL